MLRSEFLFICVSCSLSCMVGSAFSGDYSWVISLSSWFVFFFFKQQTAYELRISDWSSDVCSSDLVRVHPRAAGIADVLFTFGRFEKRGRDVALGWEKVHLKNQGRRILMVEHMLARRVSGRASCRDRVCQYG